MHKYKVWKDGLEKVYMILSPAEVVEYRRDGWYVVLQDEDE